MSDVNTLIRVRCVSGSLCTPVCCVRQRSGHQLSCPQDVWTCKQCACPARSNYMPYTNILLYNPPAAYNTWSSMLTYMVGPQLLGER
jgi:hypothetical protein